MSGENFEILETTFSLVKLGSNLKLDIYFDCIDSPT